MKNTVEKSEDSPANATSQGFQIQQANREIPTIYADNTIGIAVGSFMCKITLATESMPGQLVPSMQIVLPTNVMHGLAKALMDIFSDLNTHQQLEATFAETMKAMKADV
jgi:hypothetical protein